MKINKQSKIKLISLFLLVVLSSAPIFAEYQFPKPSGFVNDYNNIISDGEETYLSSFIAGIERNTTAEIAVAAFSSINESGLDSKEYAVKLFEAWGIGKKGKDNGVLVLLVLDSRRIEVEVGYGLEGILPDGKVGRILDANLDYFKRGDYSSGTIAVVSDIGNVIASEGSYEPEKQSYPSINYAWVMFALIFLGIPIAMTVYELKGRKCPKCGTKMEKKIKGNYIVYTCPKCGYTEKKKMMLPLIVFGGAGRGGHGGGFGGFGGGGSGGGGGGRGF